MKNMNSVSDGDFDEIFRDKFHTYEAKPSPAVWEGIKMQLETNGTRSFPVLRIAAASLTAVVGLGLWLAAHKEPMKLTRAETVSVPSTSPVKSGRTNQPLEEKATTQPVIVADAKGQRNINEVRETRNPARVVEPEPSDDIIFANKEVSEISSLPEVVSISQGGIAVKSEKPLIEPVSVMAFVGDSEIAADAENGFESTRKARRIKSVGGLVNFVVSQVDKRKNKIIEFEDNEEGTKVSGVNLGLLKFKAKE